MKNTNKLIVDAGFHQGEDSSFYLHKGYNVVAIDASAELVREGEKKFKKYIKNGQLKILNYAISDKNNLEIEFHIGQNTLWNSINKNITNRQGKFIKTIKVESITLLEIFKKYGVPYYCKIDLEGMDILAIRSLKRGYLPKYISCESECYGFNEKISSEASLATLIALKNLGYNKFKLIEQYNLSEIKIKEHLYRKKNYFIEKMKNIYELILWKVFSFPTCERQKLSKKYKFSFPKDGSGPGPLDDKYLEPNTWLDFNIVKELILFYKKQKFDLDGKNLWMDIHATFVQST